jgi:hypothetical protein
VLHHGRHNERRFSERKARTDANARTDAEWQIGKPIDLGAGGKSIRSELVGPLPQQPMAMQHVGSDDHHRARLDSAPRKLICRDRGAADGGQRRIEADRLFDHGAGFDETFGEPPISRSASASTRSCRCADQLMVLAVVSWPAAMKVMILANLRLAHRLPGFRILGLEQQRENVVRHVCGVLRQAAAAPGDDGVDGTIEEHERRMRLDATKSGDELGQAEEVERIDASDDIEIAPHGGADFPRVPAEAVGATTAPMTPARNPPTARPPYRDSQVPRIFRMSRLV